MSTLVVHHFGPDPATVGGIATVIRLLTEHNIGGDVVDSHPTWRSQSPLATNRLVAASAKALLGMSPPVVAHIHLSERGSFLREGALAALARRRGLVTVATIHGASFIPFARNYPWLVSAVLKRAHLVTCLEQRSLDVVQRCAPSVRCEIVPNPVLADDGFLPADMTDELVVFAGEIGLRKGADVLYRAWHLVAQRRPEARCLMVGPVGDFAPPYAERLEVRSPVDPIGMKKIMRKARVIALPARAEAMPMTLIEAMSLGRPFVSTPVGAIAGLADAGGVLVAVDDHVDLADRLTDLLAHPGLARTIGERGRQFCVKTRSVELIDDRLRNLYTTAGRCAE
jgi:glycosyltransferase involved in cell wall biosynthesis